ncbi:hypothetical protein Lepto7375DRAFT_6719 [Leptolyngbya sp. PCC 7375]|nr:hypothetical protein Lepto7375DRAFT_6719 [Leptolyngbya sp. PCC 7375]
MAKPNIDGQKTTPMLSESNRTRVQFVYNDSGFFPEPLCLFHLTDKRYAFNTRREILAICHKFHRTKCLVCISNLSVVLCRDKNHQTESMVKR